MESRFNEKARCALSFAHETAIKLSHTYVGTEDILLGILKEGSSKAYEALAEQGITFEKIVDIIAPQGISDETSNQNIPMTPRSKTILELSFAESRRTGSPLIGCEHILLAIIKEGDGIAAKILFELGFDVQKAIAFMFSSSSPKEKNAKKDSAIVKSLEGFGSDLTLLAKEGKIDPIIGRDKEIERVIQILSRRTKNNPCLIGEPGVGKTAVAEGLAYLITNGNVPETLKDKTIFSLDLSSMIAGTKYRGEFEERIKKALDDVKKNKNIILFIDEVHTIVGAGAAEGAMDAANILKPLLARGELQIIGATTLNEYRKNIEKDSALERRFQPIIVGEPTVEETIEILKGIRDKYEAHHKVKISDEALTSAAKLSARYITDRFLPDKAIDLIDEAASKIRMKTFTMPPQVKELEDELKTIKSEKEEAIKLENFEEAARIRDEEEKKKKELEKITNNWKEKANGEYKTVGEDEICDVITQWTNIPVKKLAHEDQEKLKNMEEILHKRVIGQNEAVSCVSKAIRRGRTGLKDPKRPTGSFIFLGPTGVGKTELSKALAEAVFGDENSIIRIDMSEYMDKHNVSKLIGSPPGFVGYDEGGQLTEKVRRKPYSVILFDEIEKAHPDVFNILLQILDDGILTDSQGRKVDFKNTIIIMTSNIGARLITNEDKTNTLGFSAIETHDEGKSYEKIKEDVMGEVKKLFRPEFINRVDEIIVFHQLSEDNIKDITLLMLDSLKQRMKNLGINISFSDEVVSYISKEGFDILYGARPLRRAIQSKVEDMLSDEMLSNTIANGDSAQVVLKDDKICLEKL
ncbi:MAG: ATP-dependent Clp protease ATP-binding subunit [Ruminococcaceae bacterium]|nr:ATP-dependent Clp protease ATP-binding subunit [Oscillospiraceae bacterium]